MKLLLLSAIGTKGAAILYCEMVLQGFQRLENGGADARLDPRHGYSC